MIRKIKLVIDLALNIRTFFLKNCWVFISENKDWAIYYEGTALIKYLKKKGINGWISYNPHLVRNSIIHFGSLNVFYTKYEKQLFKSNKTIVTFYHGYFGMDKTTDKMINYLLSKVDEISLLIVSNSIMFKRMMSYGVPEHKLKLIPIPVDEELFNTSINTGITRKEIGLTDNMFTIGSFQKDGTGWEEGNLPKLSKGPDLFCNAVKSLSNVMNVQVLLIGPARGYAIERLKEANIKYVHLVLDSLVEVSQYYSLIDMYLVSSREEGGPKAILESVATNCPIVSSNVGMAPDVFSECNNLVYSEKSEEYIECILRFAGNEMEKEKLLGKYKGILKEYGWDNVIGSYIQIHKELGFNDAN